MIKNVVVVADFAEVNTLGGGAARVSINTAYLLSKKGLKVYFFTGTGEPDPLLKEAPGLEIIHMGQKDILSEKNRIKAFVRGIYNFKAYRELKKLLGKLDKEETVVHIHSWFKVLSSSVFKAVSDMDFRMFITVHEYLLCCPTLNLFNYQENHVCEIKPMSLKCILTNCDKRHYYHKVWRCIRQYVQNKIISNITQLGGG